MCLQNIFIKKILLKISTTIFSKFKNMQGNNIYFYHDKRKEGEKGDGQGEDWKSMKSKVSYTFNNPPSKKQLIKENISECLYL